MQPVYQELERKNQPQTLVCGPKKRWVSHRVYHQSQREVHVFNAHRAAPAGLCNKKRTFTGRIYKWKVRIHHSGAEFNRDGSPLIVSKFLINVIPFKNILNVWRCQLRGSVRIMVIHTSGGVFLFCFVSSFVWKVDYCCWCWKFRR